MSGAEPVGSGVPGTGKADPVPAFFWYDGHHIVHRREDDTLEYIGWECWHDDTPLPRIMS